MKTFKEFNNINEENTFTNEADSGLEGVRTFKNGLSVEIIKEKYPWLLKAKFKNAVIGEDKRFGIVWYEGTWIDGTWENGYFDNGTWENGTWKNGTWQNGEWYGGVWEDGHWLSGKWFGGKWKKGKWHIGYNGTSGKVIETYSDPNNFQ